MLRDAHLTDGIGVEIAHNIHCKSANSPLSNRDMTSLTSSQQKKKRVHNIKNYTGYYIGVSTKSSCDYFYWFYTTYFRFTGYY